MKIHLKRSGGVAGIQREWKWEECTTNTNEICELTKVLERLDFFSLPREIKGPQEMRDEFFYELTVEEKDKRHTVKCMESAAPEPFRNCVEWLLNNQ